MSYYCIIIIQQNYSVKHNIILHHTVFYLTTKDEDPQRYRDQMKLKKIQSIFLILDLLINNLPGKQGLPVIHVYCFSLYPTGETFINANDKENPIQYHISQTLLLNNKVTDSTTCHSPLSQRSYEHIMVASQLQLFLSLW